eukprot:502658_1
METETTIEAQTSTISPNESTQSSVLGCCDGSSIHDEFNDDISNRITFAAGKIIKNKEQFEQSIDMYINYTWRQSCCQKCLAITSFLALLLSAAINVAFMSSNLIALKREKSEDYNLTEHMITWVEAICVYLLLLIFIAMFLFWPNSANMNFYLIAVSSMNILNFLGGLSPSGFIKISSGIWKMIKGMAASGTGFGYYVAVLLSILFPIEFTFLCGLAAGSVVLRLRQMTFVASVYFTEWDRFQVFRFIGFLNTMISLTKKGNMGITCINKLLLNVYDTNVKDIDENAADLDSKNPIPYSFTSMINQYIMKTKGRLVGLILCNFVSDETYIRILRNEDFSADAKN